MESMTSSPSKLRYAWRTALAAGAAGVLLALALGACAKKITEVDSTYVSPEGQPSADAQMIVWHESAVVVENYLDTREPAGPGRDPFCPNQIGPAGDAHTSTEVHQFRPEGSINAMILDHTEASSFRLLRRESNGGYRQPLNFPIKPARKWLEYEWEAYDYNDPSPSGFQPPTYLARGIVSNLSGPGSPLTNQAEAVVTDVADIGYTGKCLPCDSLFTLRWDSVPGASRYWLQVYQLAPGTSENAAIQSMRLAPINIVKSRDLLLGSVDASVTSYKFMSGSPNLNRLVEKSPNFGQSYLVRVSAVDSLGQMIAITKGDFGALDRDGGYGLVRLGAVIVFPKHSGVGPPFCQPETEPADLVSSRNSRPQ